MTLRQKACEKIALLPNDNVRVVLALLDEMIRQNNEYIVDNKKTSVSKHFKFKRTINVSKKFHLEKV